jgi:hypothetical protein
MDSGLVQVLEILVICFMRQNLARGFVEYINVIISLGAENSVVGGPKVVSYSFVIE